MELWIRSQDREQLVNARGVLIEKKTKSKYFNIFGSGYFLGTYATKERALEVLDMIQFHLVNINDVRDRYFYVYEMPKE